MYPAAIGSRFYQNRFISVHDCLSYRWYDRFGL